MDCESQRKKNRVRNSIQGQYAHFVKRFSEPAEWEKLGWLPVPTLDGKTLNTWEAFEEKHFGGRRSFMGLNDSPYHVVNQELVSATKFIEQMRKKSLSTLVNWMKRQEKVIPTGKLKCSDDVFKTSYGWAMEMSSFTEMERPSYLDVNEQNAIITWGGWFTEGHIELAGDESISHVPIGKKVYLIAKRGPASKYLVNQTKCAKEFMNLVVRGPPALYKEKIFYFISSSKSVLLQPALCAHSVLTLSKNLAIVMGWEAGNKTDAIRAKHVSDYYGFGVGCETKAFIKTVPKQKRGDVIKVLKQTGVSDMTELLERLHERNDWIGSKKAGNVGRPTLSKQKRRILNIRSARKTKNSSKW